MQGALILAILDVVCFILQYESRSFDVFFSWKLYKIIYIIVINSSAEVGRANHAQEGLQGLYSAS